MHSPLSPTDSRDDRSTPQRYGLRGACWGAMFGAVMSGGLFWLTGSYVSFAALPIVTACGYWLRPGIRDPGSLKSRW
jgi:hypothetical protein